MPARGPQSKQEADSGGNNGDWYDFTQDVTMHGVKYVHIKDRALSRRAIWLILLLGSMGYCSYACFLFMDDYVKKVVSTKIQVEKADVLKFPTVTFCNRNLWTLDAINSTVDAFGSYAMYEIIRDLYVHTTILPPPEGKYDWNSPELSAINNLTADQTEAFWEYASHSLDMAFISCQLKATEVPCREVVTPVITDGGFCFQFNSDGLFNSTSAGIRAGATFLLDTQVSQYSIGPNSHAEGYSITLHDSTDVPLVTELSLGLRPGTQASMNIQKTETKRQAPPADDGKADCFEASVLPNKLKYYPEYSYSACYIECKTQYVLDRCGCRDPLQPPMNGSRLCLIPEMLSCSTYALRTFTSAADGLLACECTQACHTAEYHAQVSSYKFPSYQWFAMEGLDEGVMWWIGENVIIVDIFYGQMSSQIVEEGITYDIQDAIASIGGTLGVCIGASLLTVFEFLEFGLLQLIKQCNKKMNTVQRINVLPTTTTSTTATTATDAAQT